MGATPRTNPRHGRSAVHRVPPAEAAISRVRHRSRDGRHREYAASERFVSRSIVLVLDEFDRLRGPEDFIEQVQSVNKEADGQIVLVLVSSQDSGAILDRTGLDYEDVMFEPYSEDELMTLLE